ncbi:MAG: hypothetical protein HFI04_14470, partial [Lachnospiraceae bacterium]|nr:hypothetical protein [Lachnospiraceae bacterium]
AWQGGCRQQGKGRAETGRGKTDRGGTEQAVHGFPCRLREMDFLNIPGKQ